MTQEIDVATIVAQGHFFLLDIKWKISATGLLGIRGGYTYGDVLLQVSKTDSESGNNAFCITSTSDTFSLSHEESFPQVERYIRPRQEPERTSSVHRSNSKRKSAYIESESSPGYH